MNHNPFRNLNILSDRLLGLSVRPRAGRDPALSVDVNFDPCRQHDFDTLIRAWLPLTYAVNSLNHSVGQPDLYPFVLAPQVMGKLRFVHFTARFTRRPWAQARCERPPAD